MIKLYNFDELKPEEILNRDIRAEKNVEDVVDAIIADVRARGDDALKDYTLKFDGATIENLQVTQAEIDEAFAGMDPYFLETLRQAAENIEQFHRQQVHKNFVMNDRPGIVLGQKYTPIEKAGVYVPGGTAAYPSTVLMDVIPAKVAGVSEIVMTTPAGKDGKVNPVILAAAATAGVTKIFKTGGAQAVAALAYGTQSIPAVDKIVGPGNIYVATAKRKVFGKVGIDMIAGPSEILVLADGSCDPAWVAADLLSQAEHDRLASPVLVTDSADLAKAVQAELEVQIPQLPRAAIAMPRERFLIGQKDTVNYYMASILKFLGYAYRDVGNHKNSSVYFERLSVLRDSLKAREQQSAALELAEIYKTNEQAAQLKEDESAIRIRTIVFLSTAILLAVAIGFIIRILHDKQIILRKNEAMKGAAEPGHIRRKVRSAT